MSSFKKHIENNHRKEISRSGDDVGKLVEKAERVIIDNQKYVAPMVNEDYEVAAPIDDDESDEETLEIRDDDDDETDLLGNNCAAFLSYSAIVLANVKHESLGLPTLQNWNSRIITEAIFHGRVNSPPGLQDIDAANAGL